MKVRLKSFKEICKIFSEHGATKNNNENIWITVDGGVYGIHFDYEKCAGKIFEVEKKEDITTLGCAAYKLLSYEESGRVIYLPSDMFESPSKIWDKVLNEV